MRETETINSVLEQRVAQKSAELEGFYRRLGELERERALEGERRRLMRDVHDGIGGQLVQAMALSKARTGTAAQTRDSENQRQVVAQRHIENSQHLKGPIDPAMISKISTSRSHPDCRWLLTQTVALQTRWLQRRICPVPRACAPADTARGQKLLSREQIQAILTSDGRPLGECRPIT